MEPDERGNVGKVQLREYFKHLGIHCTEAQLNRVFNKLDENHDGGISFVEFVHTAAALTEVAPQMIVSQMFTFSIHIPHNTTTSQVILAGLAAGAVSRTLTAPFDRLRGLQSAGNTSTLGNNSSSLMYGLRAMYNKGGIRAFFQGNGMNVVQVGPESAITFFLFDRLKKEAKDPRNLTSWEKFIFGGTRVIIS